MWTRADMRIVLVKRLAKKTGMIVIASIHQPNFEVFSLFDNLLLLAEGKVMYHGKTGKRSFILFSLPIFLVYFISLYLPFYGFSFPSSISPLCPPLYPLLVFPSFHTSLPSHPAIFLLHPLVI
jgi:hypothetical protein